MGGNRPFCVILDGKKHSQAQEAAGGVRHGLVLSGQLPGVLDAGAAARATAGDGP